MPGIKSAGRRSKGDVTRSRIIEKAAPVFNQRGYAGTSMSDLMAATGLEKGGIYRHFDSKQSLALAAFDYAWEAVSAPRKKGLDRCQSPLEKLLRFIRNFAEEPILGMPGGCPLMNTAVESDDGDPLLRERAVSALDGWRENLAAIVREGQEAGELPVSVDPGAMATIIIAGLEGAIMMSRLERSREPLRLIGNHVEEHLLRLKNANDRSPSLG